MESSSKDSFYMFTVIILFIRSTVVLKAFHLWFFGYFVLFSKISFFDLGVECFVVDESKNLLIIKEFLNEGSSSLFTEFILFFSNASSFGPNFHYLLFNVIYELSKDFLKLGFALNLSHVKTLKLSNSFLLL
jgi:hypothetical protein